jgi:phospholipase C
MKNSEQKIHELLRPSRPSLSQLTPRRRFIETTAVSLGALAFASARKTVFAAIQKRELPKPQLSGIEHIVVVMMENRSFDHFLGWLPGAEGRQAGLAYIDRTGMPHMTAPLAPDYQGCSHPDPDHSYAGGRMEYNGGACDGWL